MPNYRFYQNVELHVGKQIPLSSQVSTHVAKVLRLHINDEITLFDGKGSEAQATIDDVKRQKVLVTITQCNKFSRESSLSLHLAQGLCKTDRMDFVIQKAVELGVETLTPIITQYTTVRLNNERSEKKLMHWARIAESAAEQSGRNCLMKIAPPMTFIDWLESTLGAYSLFLDPNSTTGFNELPKTKTSVSIMIGPEGGFSPDERHQALRKGCVGISLGPRILRTETAAISACTLAQAHWGDLNVKKP